MLCSISKLDAKALERIQNLESQLGQTLIALSVQSLELSNPTQDAIKQMQQVEQELGVILLAVEK